MSLRSALVAAMIGLLSISSGCHVTRKHASTRKLVDEFAIQPVLTPRELCKTTLPTYRIEPPDILDISAVRLVPKASYLLNTMDVLRIQVQRADLKQLAPGDSVAIRVPGAPTVAPIDDVFIIQPDGSVSLGSTYGLTRIRGLTLDEAQVEIENTLSEKLKLPKAYVTLVQSGSPVSGEFAIEIDGTIDFGEPYGRVFVDGMNLEQARQVLTEHFLRYFESASLTVNLLQSSAAQQVLGEHLVGPDGTITLGIYGSVNVTGLSVEQAKYAIEYQLGLYLDEPQVAVTVRAFNSKVYYIVTEGGGFGEGVYRFPITGNETVLDALSLLQGLPTGSSYRMWIARPNSAKDQYQTLPVEWSSLTALAATETNYQLLPGDRLYIAHDPLVAFDNGLAKLTAPLERVMGFSILGAETATRLSGKVLRGGGNPRQF